MTSMLQPLSVRRRLAVAIAVTAAACWSGPASAQGYPSQPIRVVVPFTPAGATDLVARLITGQVATLTGWTFVVENRPGASGNIGLDAVAKGRPDGYLLAMGQTANLAINPALFAKMPFDTLKDFAPVALVASLPVVLIVRADSPWKNVADLIAAAKAKPGQLTQALASNGTVGHLTGELWSRRAGIRFTNVPYKGAAPALTDLMGGQTDIMFVTPQSVASLIKGGKVRALAVSSSKRVGVLPEVPTLAEAGFPGFESVDWKMLVAPAGTPPEVIATLNAAVNKALAQPAMLAQLQTDGSAPMGGTPAEALAKIRSERERWGALVHDADIKLD